jgi:hypothetical protein
MKRLALLLILATLPLPPAASAIHAAGYPVDEWCGDYVPHEFRTCERVGRVRGRIKFEINTGLEFRSIRLCVTPPHRDPTCHRFYLRENLEGASKRLDFTRHFPHRARGRYAVRWFIGGKQHGEALHFHFPRPYLRG